MPLSFSQPLAVILIDDDEDHLRTVERTLRRPVVAEVLGCPVEVSGFREAAEALANLPAAGQAVILCDYQMPCGTGVEWVPDLLKSGIGPVIILTAEGSEEIAAEAFRAGASDYFNKMDAVRQPDRLASAMQQALRRHRLEDRNNTLSRELKITNKELRRSNDRLTQLTATAHRFVDDVAHEFRTPLTVILEFASILHDGLGGPVTEDQARYLDYIDAATRELSQMVDDFLDTSKLRAQSLRVDRKHVRVETLFDAVRPMLQTRAEAKQVCLKEDLPANLPTVFCDAEKAGRVLVNLVVNALKFSPKGERVRVWARDEPDGGVRIGVTDRGPGLGEAELAKLGERFRQGSSARGSAKGFGLGLSIAMDLARVNLGDLQIESELGRGSTFSFSLPGWEPAQVLQRYTERFRDREEPVQLSLLEVDCPIGRENVEEVRVFLASACRSMDLVLVPSHQRSVVLLGPADRPVGWIERLQEGWAAFCDGARTKRVSSPLRVHWLGSWAVPAMAEQIRAMAMERLEGLRACA